MENSGPAVWLTGACVAEDEKSTEKTKSAVKTKKVPLKVSAVRSVSAEDSAADKKSLGQVRKTFIFLGFVAIAYAAYLVFTGQVDEFVSSLAGVDLAWIVAPTRSPSSPTRTTPWASATS